MNGASVRFPSPAAIVCVQTRMKQDLWHAFFIVWVLFVRQCFGGGALTGPFSRLWTQ